MRKSIALGTFAALAAGSVGAGALDSVPSMRGSDTLKDITTNIVSQCTALAAYPADNSPAAGNQPIVYDGTGSGNGENAMKPATAAQLIAPMSRSLGTGICDSATSHAGAEGIIFALDGLSVVFNSTLVNAAGIDYTGTAGNSSNVWRTVLREVYTGMGASGNNISPATATAPVAKPSSATGTTCSPEPTPATSARTRTPMPPRPRRACATPSAAPKSPARPTCSWPSSRSRPSTSSRPRSATRPSSRPAAARRNR